MNLNPRVIIMLRHPKNSNLHLHRDDAFDGLPVMADKGPFIRAYLARLKQTIDRALDQYPRVLAFRVDLRLPRRIELPDDVDTNDVIRRFIASFSSKIEHNRDMARKVNKYAHDSRVRYVWAREEGLLGRPHYHLVIMLSLDAFYTVGKISSDNENIFHRLQQAWASALRLPVGAVSGLVELPNNPMYRLRRDGDETYRDLFYRASYLCKDATKVFGDGKHAFGCSRR